MSLRDKNEQKEGEEETRNEPCCHYIYLSLSKDNKIETLDRAGGET